MASIITIGNFDGVHYGHQKIINFVVKKAIQKKLISIVITFKNHPRKFFQPSQPEILIYPLEEKRKILKNLGINKVISIDFNSKIASLSPEDFIKKIVKKFSPKEIVVGEGFRFGFNRQGSVSTLRKLGEKYKFKVTELKLLCKNGEKIGSEKIRELIKKSNFQEVNYFLGRPYYICGRVEKGKGLGKKIGVPTANLKINEEIILPRGVFKVKAKIKNKIYPAVAYIGNCPTLSKKRRVCEVYLKNYDGKDLYNQKMKITFLEKLRNEIKFSSLAKLKEQILKDIENV